MGKEEECVKEEGRKRGKETKETLVYSKILTGIEY
jgi:hypothetical protein